MKYLFLLFACILFSCQKEQAQCPTCFLVIGNATLNTYIAEVRGVKYRIDPGELQNVEIPAGEDVRVFGTPITDKAHNNFSKSYMCGGDCGAISVVLTD